MKPKTNRYIGRIKHAADELQAYSFTEFQKILPVYLNSSGVFDYAFLDKYFAGETGMPIQSYFNRVKAEKVHELLDHYRLSQVEVAYQLGFRNTTSLRKAIGSRKQYPMTGIRYRSMHGEPPKIQGYML